MARLIIVIFLLSSLVSLGQNEYAEETDTSFITTNYHGAYGYTSVSNKLKNLDKTYYRKLDGKSKRLREEGVFLNGYCVGIWNYYSKGKLVKAINYDSGKVTYNAKKQMPFSTYFNFIQTQSDSLLIQCYGQEFFSNNIRWNARASYYYGPGIESPWFEETSVKPNKFMMRYDVLYGDGRFPLIAFNLDSLGNVVEGYGTKGTGKCNYDKCMFNIGYDDAIVLAKSEGLKLDSLFVLFLRLADGSPDFQLVVADYVKSTKENSKTTYSYDAIVINPWNGKVIERTRMKSLTLFDNKSSYQAGQMYSVKN